VVIGGGAVQVLVLGHAGSELTGMSSNCVVRDRNLTGSELCVYWCSSFLDISDLSRPVFTDFSKGGKEFASSSIAGKNSSPCRLGDTPSVPLLLTLLTRTRILRNL
jgi:hypothetical protein